MIDLVFQIAPDTAPAALVRQVVRLRPFQVVDDGLRAEPLEEGIQPVRPVRAAEKQERCDTSRLPVQFVDRQTVPRWENPTIKSTGLRKQISRLNIREGGAERDGREGLSRRAQPRRLQLSQRA